MKYKTDDFTDWHICQAHLREPFPYRYPDLPPRFRLCRAVSRGIFLLQYGSEAALFAGLLAGGVFLYVLRRETSPPLLGVVVLLSVFLAFLFTALRFLPRVFWHCPCCKTRFPYYRPARGPDFLEEKDCLLAMDHLRIPHHKFRCCPLVFPSVCPECKQKFFQKDAGL